MRVRRFFRQLCLGMALLCSSTIPKARAATPEEVDAAIQKAVDYLYSRQKDGNWEAVARRDESKAHHEVRGWQWGGLTSIATCALLYAGQNPRDPRIRQAVEWLLNAEMYGTYAVSFRCQVWSMLPPDDAVRAAALRDAELLMRAHIKEGPARGYFPYYFYDGKARPSDKDRDHSLGQYGVLGLWACAQLRIEIPTGFWAEIEQAWQSGQYPTGGWSYRYRSEQPAWAQETLSMTSAGVATLFITQEYLHAMDGLTGGPVYVDPYLERGLKWIAEHFNDYRHQRTYYTLYGLERIGVASGYKYLGGINWYAQGAEYLVRHQHDDGSFGEPSDNDNYDRIPDTSFALMFLSRGRAPVMMNKLDYATGSGAVRSARLLSWNQRPREVANITRWVGKQVERDLNWQIVTLQAPVEDLHDAPILWISGTGALSLTPEQEAKLKLYVEQGGMILGNADMGSRAFAESFRRLGQKLFPYEFRELPAGHPVYTMQQFPRANWKKPPQILSLGNGVRELMLLIPTADAGRGWQIQQFIGPEREPLAQFMANLFLYSVDKRNLRYKGQTYLETPDPKIKARRSIRLARLQYAGNWDPEPGGWRRLGAILHNRHGADLVVEAVRLGSGRLDNSYAVAHMTGTTALNLQASEQAELRRFVQGGGLLLADAAGGSVEFAAAAEKLLTEVFKPASFQGIAMDHPIMTAGQRITALEYRAFARRTLGRVDRLRLMGMEIGGRTGVIFSPGDISAGLVGQPVDGISGFEPGTASALAGNIILYAAR